MDKDDAKPSKAPERTNVPAKENEIKERAPTLGELIDASKILDANHAREVLALKDLITLVPPQLDTVDRESGRDQLTGRTGSRFERADAARQAAAGATFFDKGYAHPDTARAPDLPDNRTQSPPSLVTAPSSDPRDWVSGSASSGLFVWMNHNSRTGVTTYGDSDGKVHQFWGDNHAVWTYHADGGLSVINYRRIDGQWRETTRAYHLPGSGADPAPHDMKKTRVGPGIIVDIGEAEIEEKPSKIQKEKEDLAKQDLVQTQDPGADPEGNAAAEHYFHGAKKPAPEVTKVNPGPDGATVQPTAAQLRPKDLNTDPWRQQRRLSQEAAERLRERIPKQVGPGGNPGDPDGPGD
jgi:hypothetical protein